VEPAAAGGGLSRVVTAAAPVRICDNGGWTDTWFARHGAVFNIAVEPCAEVEVRVLEGGPPGVVLDVEDFGDRYAVTPQPAPWGPHPLLEAAISSARVPQDLRLEIRVHSAVPTGAGTGTSAAVTVALLGALDALTPGRMTPDEVARAAHSVETGRLGRESGVQDQLAAAHGGISYVEIPDYPRARVFPVRAPSPIEEELEARLALIYLGRSHDSSAIHEQVIRSLREAGPEGAALEDLRRTAARSRDAVSAGDLATLGRAMVDNTAAQARLNRGLVGSEASRVISIARDHGALGWKVNGAGGAGGSVTLLSDASPGSRDALVGAIEAALTSCRSLPIRLNRSGLRVVTHDGAGD
jgi:D-glycero-alpha-D-manno-heptose-7-phosphate kinase